MDEKKRFGGMKIMFLVLALSMLVPFLWTKFPVISEIVHLILDPSAGRLLNWNLYIGMFAVVALLSLITTLFQKYGTDQASLKKLKEEQKLLQEEIKKYKNHPEKMMELNKKQLEFLPKTMDITMKPTIFTFIPFILLYKWFVDFFALHSEFKFFNFLSWPWFYIIFLIVFGSIWRKMLKVA